MKRLSLPTKRPSTRSRVPRKASTHAKARVQRILSALEASIPVAHVELDSTNPLELLVATILSAQCTDERVNMVTPALFARYRSATDFANADQSELENLIRSTGFYKSKARNIKGCCRVLVEQFQGKVPDKMELLTTLPGVGRKTANVLLGSYFGQPAIVVDTHVKRMANRLHLTPHQDPTDIEFDLQRVIPKIQWTKGVQRLLLHGRYVCQARHPKCEHCILYANCSWEGKQPRS